MATLIQQRTLNEMVNQYAGLYGLPVHKAFLFLIIERYLQKLELNSIDIEESIVDGSDDCGIDAIVIDEESELRPHVYFFQSKFYQADNAFERQFEGSALEKIQSAINDFVISGRINAGYQNSRLVDKLHSVKNLGDKNPSYTIVLCSNSKGPADAARLRLEEFVRDANRGANWECLSVEYLHLDKIIRQLVAPQQNKQVNIELQTSGKYLSEDTGNVRLFVGAVEAKDLITLVEKHGDELFERNVRTYLQQSNQVNKNIIRSATGQHSPYFVYMNNGVTMTCEKFKYSPSNNSPKLEITNAQIVNGQQTVRSLHQAGKANDLKTDVKVLVRIVETTDTDLLRQIIEATNSQTRVTSRDLHSNDEIQKLIENHLLSKGYFYEARKNKYKGKAVSKRIDAEVAAQAYYAIFREEPAIAKDKKKLLFGEKYEELFNENTQSDEIMYSFLLLKTVQMYNSENKYKDQYTFLNDATLHTATLIHRIAGMNNPEIFDYRKSYEKAIKALAQLVKERTREEGDKYEHRRTFKDAETYGRAVEILKKIK